MRASSMRAWRRAVQGEDLTEAAAEQDQSEWGGDPHFVHVPFENTLVKDPSEIVKVQQEVNVTVLEVDLERNRISLSMKGAVDKAETVQKPKPSRSRKPKSPRPAKKNSARPAPKKAKKEKVPFNNPFADMLNKM